MSSTSVAAPARPRFPAAQFDLAISRFGTMFFADPVAAFTNIGHALRPAARLVMLVWQDRDRQEWATAIHESLAAGRDLLAELDAEETERAIERLRATLAAHDTGDGVWFDARAWIVIAHRRG